MCKMLVSEMAVLSEVNPGRWTESSSKSSFSPNETESEGRTTVQMQGR